MPRRGGRHWRPPPAPGRHAAGGRRRCGRSRRSAVGQPPVLRHGGQPGHDQDDRQAGSSAQQSGQPRAGGPVEQQRSPWSPAHRRRAVRPPGRPAGCARRGSTARPPGHCSELWVDERPHGPLDPGAAHGQSQGRDEERAHAGERFGRLPRQAGLGASSSRTRRSPSAAIRSASPTAVAGCSSSSRANAAAGEQLSTSGHPALLARDDGRRRSPRGAGAGRAGPGELVGSYWALASVPRYSSITLGSFISDWPVSV